jgi:membrane protease YdiL (CAAX protease family)
MASLKIQPLATGCEEDPPAGAAAWRSPLASIKPRSETTEPAGLGTVFSRFPVAAGFILMFALTWPLELGLAAQSRGLLPFRIPPVMAPFVGLGFVAAAMIMSVLVDGTAGVVALLRRLLIWRVGLVWYVVALLGPAVTYLLGIGIHVLLGGSSPDFLQPFVRQLVPPTYSLAVAGLVFFLFQLVANGEEFGWRGYALPKLQARHSALIASLIVGVVWALWHVPKYLTAGDPHDLPFWFFALNMLASAILYTWIFNCTGGSLLLMLLLHAAVNTGIVMLPIMPAIVGDTRPLIIAYVVQDIAAVAVAVIAGTNLGRAST